MSIKVKGFLKDVGGASRVTALRKNAIENASNVPDPKDHIREVADLLHPAKMEFVVESVRDTSPSAKVFRMRSADGHIPVFQCGQYVNFRLKIGESNLTRPYTLSSAPCDARGENGYFEVTIRRNRPYLVPDWFFENVKPGTHLEGNMPFGTFYYEPMRDSKNVVAMAGGSGITPFYSMAREIAFGKLTDVRLTILYGSVHHSDIILGNELAEIEKQCPNVRVIHILSGDEEWQGEKGFLTREIVEKYAGEDPTYMFCGPYAMFQLVEKIMKEMGVGPRRYRHDVLAQPNHATNIPNWPMGNEEKTWKITVVRGIDETVIDACGGEPVAVALERAGIPVDTHCRCGECGYCRSKLLSGSVFVPEFGDGRRRMDKEFGWFHACVTYPTSDLKIKVNIM
ncbi:MAG: iron-sulfur cluster-binding domain-containing protein [Lachnospiraceae bacterium]|nr:iron-sulfur cluster-binding domain-containing protein [Lachnospiraceae bacterium]MBR4768046.1 iron-sulfur cluster-binding domain-containing protein [Lachnospiraceae bacterium]